jgi:ribosomal protein S18 acetylase RimI-like enzyme
VLHPSPDKLKALADRWTGQEKRLERIAASLVAGEDWTVHLRGLPFVDEVPPREGEAYGRDLRGADLRRHLHPPVEIVRGTEREAGVLASLCLEAARNNTPLPERSPFPADVESAEGIALAMRRGDRFLLARSARKPVGAVRWAPRREFAELCDGRVYAEVSGLAVDTGHRRVGIGARLLAAAEADAGAEGYETGLLRTSVEVGLVSYYEARGWSLRFVRQHAYPESPTFLDAVLTKRLAVIDAGEEASGVAVA